MCRDLWWFKTSDKGEGKRTNTDLENSPKEIIASILKFLFPEIRINFTVRNAGSHRSDLKKNQHILSAFPYKWSHLWLRILLGNARPKPSFSQRSMQFKRSYCFTLFSYCACNVHIQILYKQTRKIDIGIEGFCSIDSIPDIQPKLSLPTMFYRLHFDVSVILHFSAKFYFGMNGDGIARGNCRGEKHHKSLC